ncbi:conserved hypothetical protein (plasmid) [Sinorhizobium fredii HH103]|uniref:Class I SAM-dependent methyltransferase n=1 Tax=Sinorhizobium fredii (strain HH103) TaxID=1117943 RepID=G9AGI1_SINF1|nr:class I SAM-dependent methyltransferase [Sinorhizobium fredii]CCF00163.1 conserved hypothetical protein [Sinorhizobium fredii HH103]
MRENQYVDGTYAEKAKGWHASESPWKAANLLTLIHRHSLDLETVCDVGCGVGEILVELQKALGPNVDFSGFDVSPHAIFIAKQKENDRLKFRNEDIITSSSHEFDLILLLDVFEHVPDYLGFLEAISARARWFIFHIPLDITVKGVVKKSKWMMYMRETYGHLHYFTAESALATLSNTGYEVLDCFYTDDYDVTDKMIPKYPRARLGYELRKYLFRMRPALAAAIFEHFNLLVLARGRRDHTTGV